MPRNRNIAQSVSTNARRPAIPAIKGVEEPYRQILNAMKKNIEIIQGTLGNQKVDQGITTEDIAAVVREMLISYSPAPPPPAPPGTAAPHTHEHGALLELGDDDHDHYLLVNGSRPLGGTWDVNHYELENLTLHNVIDEAARLDVSGTLEGGIFFQNDNRSAYVCKAEGSAASTIFLVHSDHADGSTDFTDSGIYNQTITDLAGGAPTAHSTGTFALGASSIYLNTSQALTVPHQNDLTLGDKDFVVESFIRCVQPTRRMHLIGPWDYHSGYSWSVKFDISNIKFMYSINGSAQLYKTFTWVATLDTWHHIAFVRKDDQLRFFVEGVQVGSTQDLTGATFYNPASVLCLGAFTANSGTSIQDGFWGYIDEIRVVYNSDQNMFNGFSVPTSFYPDGAASSWGRVAYHEDVVYDTLDTNGDIGTSANQVPDGATVLLVDGSRSLSGDWDAGAHKITVESIQTDTIDVETINAEVLNLVPGTTGGLYFEAAEATVDITAVHTCTIEVNIPSGAKLLNVQLRVDAALAAGETWDAQYVTGATQSIAAAQAVAVNTKVNKFFDENAATPIASAEVDITIQRSSNPGVDVFTAQGTIRAIVYYQANTTMADV